jgi:hypothetical protein
MKINNLHDLVMDFIHQFTSFGPAVADCFSNGMCYHFTLILCARFGHAARRVYDPVVNHFAVEIDGKIYLYTANTISYKGNFYVVEQWVDISAYWR